MAVFRPIRLLALTGAALLTAGSGCGFDWDRLDPRLDDSSAGGASGGAGGEGAGTSQGGATTSTGGSGGTSTGVASGTGGMGGNPPQLTNAGLVVRYYLDEADSGQAPTQVFDDAQVQQLDLVESVSSRRLGELRMVRQPATLGRTPSTLRTAPPERGEHTDEVLKEFGYTVAEIEDFRRRLLI